jgi:acetyl-CoA synthetase
MVRHTQAYAIGHTVTAKYVQDLKPTDIIWVHADTGWAKAAWGKLFGQWIVGAAIMQWKMGGRFEPQFLPEIHRALRRNGVSVRPRPRTV